MIVQDYDPNVPPTYLEFLSCEDALRAARKRLREPTVKQVTIVKVLREGSQVAGLNIGYGRENQTGDGQ